MKINQFIQTAFENRAEKAGALVVYDPERRYRNLVLGMADDRFELVDVTDSFIEAHEAAVDRWSALGKMDSAERRLIIYVPMAPPATPEERCLDPFSGIAAGTDWFPRSDDDSFQSLCEKAKPEHRDKIRELFANGVPDLATIDAVGAGNTWPQLETLLGVESSAEIIAALLVPSENQQQKLNGNNSWITEARELLSSQLGFVPKTKTKKWDSVADELWRFVLFSEFAFDLPGELPESLAIVPRARPESQTLINRVCDILRQEPYHSAYIRCSDRVAVELTLEERMRNVSDLGERDTFAFEERSFLGQYVRCLLDGNLGRAAEIAGRRRNSIWVRHTERGMLWTVAEKARELLVAADDLDRDLAANAKSAAELISFYTSRGYRLDQANRELEKAVADTYGEVDGLEELIESAGNRFLAVTENLQRRFIDCVAKDGWPVSGRLRATQVFDKTVAPLLETRGVKVALFFVDSLRFELAVALERQLSGTYTCHLETTCAQLPTVTPVGMAALLPKADGNLRLISTGGELVPAISRKQIRNPSERFAYVQEHYGDRVSMVDLDAFVSTATAGKKKQPFSPSVDLLLIKTTDIDDQGELDAASVCVFLPHILGKLITAVGKLNKLGFHHAIFATDHGFGLLPKFGPGDTVAKPAGDWLQLKDRCMLGYGPATSDTVSFSKEQVGIQGDIANFVVPRSFGTFNKRHPYFHGGLSLPEAVIPVLTVNLGNEEAESRPLMDVQLRYRGESSGTITTRRPVLDVCVFGRELFTGEIAFRLEARAKTAAGETVVGEAASCAYADPATGVVKVKAGQAVKVPLRIVEDFNGMLEVRAVDAETGVIYGAPLKLKAEILT
jgi:hypothetical protein